MDWLIAKTGTCDSITYSLETSTDSGSTYQAADPAKAVIVGTDVWLETINYGTYYYRLKV
jgi:hypothetical protein